MSADSPFAPTYSRQSFLETHAGGEALRRLEEGLGAREPFLLITGEPGTGKTTLAHEAVARWGERVRAAFLAYPARTSEELLEEIIRRFGAEPPDGASRPKLFACLERALESTAPDRLAVLVVDDAHELAPGLFEELKLLVGAAQRIGRPIEVLLVGLPALEARLDDPALAALRQRISVKARMEPLSPGETKRYLQHRVTAAGGDGAGLFPRKTCRVIAALTGGVPRQINVLASEAMRVARAAGESSVWVECVNNAAATLWGVAPARGEGDDEGGSDDVPVVAASAKPSEAVAPPPAPAKPPQAVTPPPAPAKPVVAPPPVSTKPPQPVTPPPPAVQAPAAAVVQQPREAAKPATPTPAPREVAKPAPPPPAAREVAKPAPHQFAAREVEPEYEFTMPPPPPPTHDPQEWVKRFVGDRGPLQISSRSAEQPWVLEATLEELARATGSPLPQASAAASDDDTPPPGDRRSRKRKPPKGPAPRRPSALERARVPAAALAAIVAVVAVVLVIRAGMKAQRPGGSGVAVIQNADPAPTAKTASRGARSSSTAAGQARPAGKGPFTLEVGGEVDLQDAIALRDRMQELTGFEGWVIPADDGERHRVVVGVYRSYDRARDAADMLLRSRTLPSVTVVPLPRRDARL